VQLPPFIEGITNWLRGLPPKAYFIAIPIPIFLVTVAVTLATSGGGGDNNPSLAVNPTVAPSLDNIDTAPSPSPTPRPTNTPVPTEAPPAPAPNRENCEEIQGTPYESPEEREWYLANCLNTTTASNDSTGGGGGSAPSGGGGAPPANSGGGGGGGGGHVSGVEYALGARLIIPSIGLDTTVTGMDVGADGAMPDPTGYFNAVLYNFPYHGGLGGSNRVMAGHVDCARCHNGGSGTAVFWSVRSLPIGATAQYIGPDGSVENYVVVSSYAVADGTDFGGIVASGSAGMTLITCTGTFGGGHYDQRHVVAFARQ
jgi:hypothetical protein